MEFQTLSDKVDELVETGGEPNVIEEIKVNGVKQEPAEKAVNITVPTAVSALDNDKKFQTEEQVKAIVSAVYKPGGSKSYAELPEASADVLGCVYNVTDGFTADAKFIDGITGTYPKGTNVVVVQVEDAYKYDVLAGFVDLTDYAKSADVATKVHTHEYAGSDSIGGSANSAKKLDTTTAGTATQPVYFDEGIPVACTYKLEANVPADAVFTDVTQARHGLMLAADKKKLDDMVIAEAAEITEMLNGVFTAE